MPVEPVVESDGRPAAIGAGTELVAGLGLDPREMGQTRDPVRAAHPSLIERVFVQLAPFGDCGTIACRPMDNRRPCRFLPMP